MNKRKVTAAVIVIIILLASFLIWEKTHYTNQNNKTPVSKVKSLPKETTIILDIKGFSPNIVTIKIGDAIRWKNESGSQQTVNSDNFPTNQLHKELNFGVFNNGSSVVYTFTKLGTYGYHNQFHYEQEGKIIVTK